MTNIPGPAAVPLVPFSQAEPRQALQVLAVTGVSPSDKAVATGTYSDRAAQQDAKVFRGRAAPADTEQPARATGESVLHARVFQEGSPQERLVAARSELSARQQVQLRAATTPEEVAAERDIDTLREAIAELEREMNADRAAEPAVLGKKGGQHE